MFAVMTKSHLHLYQHFLVFHVVMTIYTRPDLFADKMDYAKSLALYFFKTYLEFYGDNQAGPNLHSFLHLFDDVSMHGSVDNFSAFKYENFLQRLKRMLRKGDKPLQQCARRYEELKHYVKQDKSLSVEDVPVFTGLHTNGPVPSCCTNPQFSCLKMSGTQFKLNLSDSCCLLSDGSYVVIQNFCALKSSGSKVIVGYKLENIEDAYTVPCPSSFFGIVFAKKLSCTLSYWPIELLQTKCFRMPFKEGFLVVPLLHSDLNGEKVL